MIHRIALFAIAEPRPRARSGPAAPSASAATSRQANSHLRYKPRYPADAKRDRIQGTVSLQITIDKTGHVANISVTGGPQELVQASIDAVQQWVYKPTLLNGEPVDVITTVDVNYTLAQ